MAAAIALFLGLVLALTCGNPYLPLTRKWIKPLLAWAIVLLGAGVDLQLVVKAGLDGFGLSLISGAGVLLVGSLLGKLYGTAPGASRLVNVGTAICGGSAIAAVGAAVNAEEGDMAVSLAIVFILNALALFIFPPIGHFAGLTEDQFGLWAALAIHDTSSVVGASSIYGPHALEVGTTVKLARALWIIPLTFAYGWWIRRRATGDASSGAAKAKPQYPWFILGFLAMSAVFSYLPGGHGIGDLIAVGGRWMLVLVLFFIGAGLTRQTLKSVSARPFLQGATLWVLVLTTSLAFIKLGGG